MLLITGGSGFIGSYLAGRLRSEGKALRLLIHHARQDCTEEQIIGKLTDTASLRTACRGIETVYHCAGYAHAFTALSESVADKHRQVNFEGTRNLVEAAGQSGVRCFIFLSSVKAMAEPGNTCVDEDFPGKPETAYGQAKRAAEEAVLAAGSRYGMHVVNLRLAMVYGHGGHGNLERMGRMVRRGLFPPLPETGNHRSLVHVDDVVAAMLLTARDTRASGRTYIITGPDAPSGRQLYDGLRQALALPPCHWHVPAVLLHGAARCGDGLQRVLQRRFPLNSEVVDRLLGSAWYSGARITLELGWQPRITLQEGLREMFSC